MKSSSRRSPGPRLCAGLRGSHIRDRAWLQLRSNRRSSGGARSVSSIGVFLIWLAVSWLSTTSGCGNQSPNGRMPEKIFGEQGLGPGQFVYPRAIAVAPDGCVFIVDKTARIQRFSAEGDFEAYWNMPECEAGKPVGLKVDARGRVLVADTHYHRVMIYDRDGRELQRFGTEGTEAGQFMLPTRVVVDADGNYYVGEYGGNDRISRFTPEGRYVSSFGGTEAGDADPLLSRPQSMEFDSQGVLWVTDACHHRICRFSREGELLGSFGVVGNAPGQMQYPYDLALMKDGSVLVCEYGNHRLQRFDRSGKSLEVWGSIGTAPGQFASPWGVAVGKNGRVYVLDSRNNRVQVFRM